MSNARDNRCRAVNKTPSGARDAVNLSVKSAQPKRDEGEKQGKSTPISLIVIGATTIAAKCRGFFRYEPFTGGYLGAGLNPLLARP
ncbi:hypothetical protein RJ640_014429 [Escallonia rubra]|uniref:Uncharacterized protein n=1 Tax=Escallonia rubra TaxID=112253 RepID=A0AA88R401_9ASTE|nr:hypothetical protein RJ640_014429 [Escallonia rubra]